LEVLAAEDEVISPTLLVLIDVEELEGIVGARKVNSYFVLEFLQEHF